MLLTSKRAYVLCQRCLQVFSKDHSEPFLIVNWVPVYTDKDQRLAVMSIGFLLNNRDDAILWRGPTKNGIYSLVRLFT